MYRTERLLSAAIESSSLEYASPGNQSESGFLGISYAGWLRVLVLAALFASVFWSNLRRLWLKTNPFFGEPNWSHAICVPVIGLYYLFVHREELTRAGAREFIFGRILRPSRLWASVGMITVSTGIYFLTLHESGIAFSIARSLAMFTGVLGGLVLMLDWSIATLLFGLGLFVYGIYPGKNDYLSDLGMVTTLFGMVLILCGREVMKIAWFPIAFLIVALPWPGLVYSWVAEPLSQLAAHVAVDVLKTTGVDSLCSGTKIIIMNANPTLPPRILNVAEACAGMRSLMTFIAVGGAVAFLSPRSLWQRMIIVASAVPIAIFCNVMRISGQGLLDHYVSPEWSESFAHQFVGMMMLLPAFFLILLVGYMLDKLFIEEADEEELRQSVAARGGVVAIQTRQQVIPAPAVHAPVTPASPGVNRPATVIPRPLVAAPLPQEVSPLQQRRPVGATPPRPITAANPGSRAVLPGGMRPPIQPSATAQKAVTPAGQNRQAGRPPVIPPAVKPPALNKPKETP